MVKKIFLGSLFLGLVACGGGSSSGGNDAETPAPKPGVPAPKANTLPVASAVSITDANGSSLWTGDELLGQYTYTDAEGDVEGATTLRWLIDGIEVATGSRYTASKEEAGKSLVFEVTPLAIAGLLTGQASSSSSALIMKRNLQFFTANTLERSIDLFATDGTEAGTISLGLTTSTVISEPVKLGEKWFFAVYNSDVSKRFLAETDGTAEGTKIFTEGPEVMGSLNLTEFNGELYFTGNGGEGNQLWVVDDTITAGATLFREIENGGSPRNFTVAGDQMFFTAYQTSTGDELWVTNGDSSHEGTHLVKNITAGDVSSSFSSFHNFKNKLYLVQSNVIWVSDGTDSGTQRLSEIPGSYKANNFVTMGEYFFFIDSSSGTPASVWGSDGVTLTRLHDSPAENKHYINSLTVSNGKVHFVSSKELYEATMAGAQKVDLSTSNVTISSITDLTNLNNKLLFSATPPDVRNSELYQYNGSKVSLVKDITGDSEASYPKQLTVLNDRVLFKADDGISGSELWETDGTEVGTVLLKDIKSGALGSNIYLDIELGQH
ncbi:MAG: hypothetical protein V7765_05795 [Oleispira sp.]